MFSTILMASTLIVVLIAIIVLVILIVRNDGLHVVTVRDEEDHISHDAHDFSGEEEFMHFATKTNAEDAEF